MALSRSVSVSDDVYRDNGLCALCAPPLQCRKLYDALHEQTQQFRKSLSSRIRRNLCAACSRAAIASHFSPTPVCAVRPAQMCTPPNRKKPAGIERRYVRFSKTFSKCRNMAGVSLCITHSQFSMALHNMPYYRVDDVIELIDSMGTSVQARGGWRACVWAARP